MKRLRSVLRFTNKCPANSILQAKKKKCSFLNFKKKKPFILKNHIREKVKDENRGYESTIGKTINSNVGQIGKLFMALGK